MSKLDEMKKNYQNIEIPEELKERVEKGISEGKQASKHRILPFAKGIGIVAAACAALVVTVNVNPTVAQAMEGVPVLGSIVKVVDFTTYSDKQENKQMEWMRGLPRYTVTYCQYGDNRMKPTDIWTNHPEPKFLPMCHNGIRRFPDI